MAPLPSPLSPQAIALNQRPHVRVGDAERGGVVELLGTHFSAGRLNHLEFEERVAAALSAQTRQDLSDVLDDLPVLEALSGSASTNNQPKTAPALKAIVALGLTITVPLVLLMLLGSLFLGLEITAFSFIGGFLALFCGFGFTYLLMSKNR